VQRRAPIAHPRARHKAPRVAFLHPFRVSGEREYKSASSVEWECAIVSSRLRVTGLPAADRSRLPARSMSLRLDEFAWGAIEHESARLGVSEEELVAFAIVYYLADLDSGRIARRIPGRPAGQSGPASSGES